MDINENPRIAVCGTVEPNGSCITSSLSLSEFADELTKATNGLVYPQQIIQHEKNDPSLAIKVVRTGFSAKMRTADTSVICNLDNVIGRLTAFDEDDQQTGNTERYEDAMRWKRLYDLIRYNAVCTIWHYPYESRNRKYTHEMMVILLHPQCTLALRIKLGIPTR
jgi:hypothetical protein